ncbi:MAG: tRNA glutamyl-Q(34) synthetase GluQRS [Gammaproteobacteria bacterium]
MSSNNRQNYLGRFAPSPTGPLHFGSLIAAVGSYLQAKHQQGQWQLRIEDIDPPREVEGASESIIHMLDKYGFEWDGEIIYQHQRRELYQDYLEQLITEEWVFPCTCSRKEIVQHQKQTNRLIYPGTCRNKKQAGQHQYAQRVKAHQGEVNFSDAIQGHQRFSLESDIGDFVVKRADGLYSYQLSVAIDDAITGVTEVVRGTDLLDSTPRQIHLQHLLGLSTPRYAHLPVATNHQGQKLSKQTFAKPLSDKNVTETLWKVLNVLGQNPEEDLKTSPLKEFWDWAIANWDSQNIPKRNSFVYHAQQ